MCVSATYRAIESTYRENLSTLLHPKYLCPHGYRLPSSPCLFAPPAQHVCPRSAFLPASNCLSPGALSSVGGSTLNRHFHGIKLMHYYRWDAQCSLFYVFKWLLISKADPTHSQALLKALLALTSGASLCVSCVYLLWG